PNVPIMQTWVPCMHTPTSGKPQFCVSPSTTPSQSSSRPLHTSVVGVMPVHVLHTPPGAPVQVCVPGVHTPTDEPHGRVRPSSTVPLQLSSRPLHTSGCGTHPPHTPPSSMNPLQSSSTPLHTSAGTGPHVPHAFLGSSVVPEKQLSSVPLHGSPGSTHRSAVGWPPGMLQ